jgi:hypothetical protein
VLTASCKPDAVAHSHLQKAVRILLALDVDQDKKDGSNPGADAWPWWERTYSQARLWPVPDGKDPDEAFALGVDLRDWISEGMPVGKLPPAGPVGPVEATAEEKAVEEEPENKGPARCWRVPRVSTLLDVNLPPEVTKRVSLDNLLKAFCEKRKQPGDYLLPCPRTESPFWWRYVKDCAGCPGHPLCLLGLVQSQIFQEALHAYRNMAGVKAAAL